jgi:hypothetical protein
MFNDVAIISYKKDCTILLMFINWLIMSMLSQVKMEPTGNFDLRLKLFRALR